MKNSNKTIFKVFLIFFILSSVWMFINFFTCDFILWGQAPSFCSTAPISVVNLIAVGYKSIISGVLPVGLGFILQLIYCYLIAFVYVNRNYVVEKIPKLLIFLVVIVFLYFAWIPASNTPQQFMKFGLGETSYISTDKDTKGSIVTAPDPAKAIRYSLIWPIATQFLRDETLKAYIAEKDLPLYLPYRLERLSSYIYGSIASIIILTILIIFGLLRKSKNYTSPS